MNGCSTAAVAAGTVAAVAAAAVAVVVVADVAGVFVLARGYPLAPALEAVAGRSG